jgi:hypothetical protein
MRYVKISKEPGVRRDLLTGQDVYSSRFLNDEEHMLHGPVEEAWAVTWCHLLAVPGFLRKNTYPFLRAFFALLGLGYTLAIVLDWYFRLRHQ